MATATIQVRMNALLKKETEAALTKHVHSHPSVLPAGSKSGTHPF